VNVIRATRLAKAGILVVVWFALISPLPTRAGDAGDPAAMHVALPGTLFPDQPEQTRRLAGKAYQNLMQARVGLPVEAMLLANATAVADQLDRGEAQLGVFQGFEFAWAKVKYPELRPLVVAVPYHEIRVCLVVRTDSRAESLADLGSEKVAIPAGTREYVRLFLDKLRSAESAHGHDVEIVKPADADDALEDVIDGKLSGALVTHASLASFQDLKPGRYARLKTLARSETFPFAVVAYKKGGVDPSILKRCSDGLSGAERDTRACLPLRVMRLKGFAPVPADYSERLDEILRAYPPPNQGKGGLGE
jgi:ABC-type phosphate/phosphonate transport system substrate-binding protein